MRWLRRSLLILAALLVLAVAGLGLWLRSEAALSWMLGEAQRHSGGALRIGSHSGALGKPILLRDVEWDAGPLHVHVDRASLEWRSVAALLGRAQLSSLDVDGVQVALRVTPRVAGAAEQALFPIHAPTLPHLPIRLVFEDVRIHHVVITPGTTLPPIRVDELGFAARVDNDSISVRQLDAQGPDLSIQGDLRLAMNQDYALDANLDWRYQLSGWAPFRGHTEAKGDAHALAVHQTLKAPYGATLEGELRDAFTTPTWHGRLRAVSFELAAAHPGWPGYGADARVGFRGGLTGTALDGSADLRGLPVGTVTSRFNLGLKRAILDIRSLTADLPEGGKLRAQGSLDFEAEQHTHLDGGWQGLTWSIAGGKLSSSQGQFELRGAQGRWDADLTGMLTPQAAVQAHATLALGGDHAWSASATAHDLKGALVLPERWMRGLQPEGDWRLAAHGDFDSVQLDRLQGGWLGGGITATGRYQQGVRQHWRLHAVLQQVHVPPLLKGWRGRLDAVLSAEGDFGAGPAPHTEVQLQSLTGTLRGKALDAHGLAVFDGTAWRQLQLDAKLGDDTARLDADVGTGAKLHWQVDAPDLAQAWPGMQGTLHSQGAVEAGNRLTLLDLTLDLEHFAWERYQADTLRLSAHADTDPNGAAELHGAGISVPGARFTKVDLHATGSAEHHNLLLDADSDQGSVHLAGSGGYAARRWQAALTEVDVTPTGDARWTAPAPWDLALTAHALHLPSACLAREQARACATLDVDNQGWHLQGDIRALPLRSAQALLPSGLEYSGTLDAKLRAAGDRHGHSLDVDGKLSPGRVRDLTRGKPLTLLAYTGGEAHLRSDPKLTVGRVVWHLADGGKLDVATRMTFGDSPTLSGRITGDIHDFALVPALIPEVRKASGRLDLDIQLAGTPSNPEFDGTSTFSQGQVSIPRLGLDLRDVQFTLVGNGDNLELDGSLRSGKGSARFDASGSRARGVFHAQGKLQGSDVRMLDVPEAQVDVTPDLSFTLRDRDLHVDGTVAVPHAALQPKDLTAAAQVSPDQEIVGEQGGPPEERWHLYSHIKLVLGSDVHFQGFNLTGDVGGELVADTVPGHPTTGDGELTIQHGVYAAYLQKLAIEHGRLMFTGGPITNPALDIRAVRTGSHPELVQFGSVEQKVGVQVRGLLQAPLVTLWSDPPLPQGQLVSYLVTGNPSSLTGGGASGGTPGVVTTSSLSGVSAQNNQDMSVSYGGFDLSRAQVQTNGGYSSGVFVGKQLGERLYLRVGQATGDPTSIFQIIYRLSTRWMLQAQSGSASSADLIYTIEH